MPVKLSKCKTCGADTYIGGNGKETHGKYLGDMPQDKLNEMIEKTAEYFITETKDGHTLNKYYTEEKLRHFAKEIAEELTLPMWIELKVEENQPLDYQDGFAKGFNEARQSILDKAKEMGIK